MGLSKKVKKLFLLAHSNLHRYLLKRPLVDNNYKAALFAGIVFSWALILFSVIPYFLNNANSKGVLGISVTKLKSASKNLLISPVVEMEIGEPTLTPTVPPTPTPTLTPTSTPKPRPKNTPTPNALNPEQYTAEQLNENTWKVKGITSDDHMSTADEIVNALNNYRESHGRARLSVDGFLSSYASERANLFAQNGGLDGHEGFRNFMNNDGFNKAGFNSLGENSAFISGPMNGDKIIKSIFGADASHDGNQLDNWTHVGVGVNGNAINVNFGKNKK